MALRKAEDLDRQIHMNVFTIDFNEELVALYGGSLRRQTHFLHECIKAILRLYKVRGEEVTGILLACFLKPQFALVYCRKRVCLVLENQQSVFLYGSVLLMLVGFISITAGPA